MSEQDGCFPAEQARFFQAEYAQKDGSDGNTPIAIAAKWVFSFALVDGFDNPSEYLR